MPQLKISPRLQNWQNKTDGLLVVIAVGSLPLLLLETISDRLPDGDRNFIFIVNLVVFIAFAIDYIVKLLLADSKPTLIESRRPKIINRSTLANDPIAVPVVIPNVFNVNFVVVRTVAV